MKKIAVLSIKKRTQKPQSGMDLLNMMKLKVMQNVFQQNTTKAGKTQGVVWIKVLKGKEMEIKDLDDRLSEFKSRLIKLLEAEPVRVREVIDNSPDEFKVEGVYAISTPDDDLAYVGMTRTKLVSERIKDHRYIDTKSDLKGMLKMNPEYPQEADDYLVRCVEVSDGRTRMFFENFAIGVLRSPFNK